MKNLEAIAEDLFNKIRGRFPSVTIGNDQGEVTNIPSDARFFDFDYTESNKVLGKVSISIDEKSLNVMYSDNFVAHEDSMTQDNWYNFLKELRQFSKKRMLNFDTRNITKSNLNRRDYNFLATNRVGDGTMNESTMYGTNKTSFQKIGNARLSIKHTEAIDTEKANSRSQKIGKIYIENAEGEKFKYPYKHLSGARAMTRHVAEGGKPYDDFGKHITGLSEELAKLRKFKTYMGRSSVMAETLSQYNNVVKERMDSIKKDIQKLQKESYYKEAFESFEVPVLEDVPDDVKENWIDQLTIKQFNEELQDVFPYIYNLVSEATKAKEIGPEDLEEASERTDEALPVILGLLGLAGAAYTGLKLTSARRTPLGRAIKIACDNGDESACEYFQNLDLYVDTNDQSTIQYLKRVYVTEPFGDFDNIPESMYDKNIESAFEEMMGQFGEGERHGNDSMYDKCWKGYRKVPGKSRGEKGSCKKIEGVELESLDSFFEGRNDSPQGDRITTDENPLVSSYDDEFKPGQPGLSGHMNLKTYMNIIGISEKYQEMLAKAVLDAGRGKKISVPDEAKADYDAEREEEGLKPRALWIELSQHHEAEKASDNASESDESSEQQKTPLGEFILSYFDYTTGQFPKGETAVLTMVEKDYGEHFIEPAKQFLEKINNRVAEVMGYKEEPVVQDNTELDSIRSLAGL